jgi:hypothetical protein
LEIRSVRETFSVEPLASFDDFEGKTPETLLRIGFLASLPDDEGFAALRPDSFCDFGPVFLVFKVSPLPWDGAFLIRRLFPKNCLCANFPMHKCKQCV